MVVAYRNEKKHIEMCLNSLIQQTYPKENLEVIAADGMDDKEIKEDFKKYDWENGVQNY